MPTCILRWIPTQMCFMFFPGFVVYAVLLALSGFAIVSLRKGELVALLLLCFCFCLSRCVIVSLLCVLVYLPRDGTVGWSVVCDYGIPRARGYKTLSCSTQLSTKFQLLIKTKIPTNEEVSCFKYLRFFI